MSNHDALGDHIRSVLASVDVQARPSEALATIRGRARRRRRSRVAATTVVAALAAPAAAAGLLGVLDPGLERVDTGGDAASSTASIPHEASDLPLSSAYLTDDPLPEVPPTEVARTDEWALSVGVSSDRELELSTQDLLSGGSSSMSASADRLGAITFSGSAPSAGDELHELTLRLSEVSGVTRAEVARVELTTETGTFSVPTISHDVLPQVRFFVFTGDLGPLENVGSIGDDPGELVGYGADGRALVDAAQARAHEEDRLRPVPPDAIPAEMAEGVRAELAAIAGRRPSGLAVWAPTWLPPGFVARQPVDRGPDGYDLGFVSADQQQSVHVTEPGSAAGPARVEVQGLGDDEQARIMRSLRPLET
jgi:hypothetical protein